MKNNPVIYDGSGRVVSTPITGAKAFDGGYIGARHSSGRSMVFDQVADHESEVGSWVISELRRKSRWMRKNTGLPRAVSKDIANHAIGPGMFVLPEMENETANEEYFEYFSQVQKTADVSGKQSFYDYQATKVGMTFWDGDAHTIYSLSKSGFPQWQSVRSHNVGNFDVDSNDPNWVDGVRRNAFGRHVAYRVKTRKGSKTIPGAFMSQQFLMEDPDQARGLPALSHAINDLHDQLDIMALEKASVKDNARVARVITNRAVYEEDQEDSPDFNAQIGEPGVYDPTEENTSPLPLEQIFGSSVVRLGKNERLENFTSARPSPAFMGFLKWLGRNTTSGCGMPYEYSWDSDGIKSSAQRAIQNRINACCALWQRVEARQTLKFYHFAILAGIARGDLKAYPGWWRAEVFAGAPEVSIDKGRDARTDMQLVKANLMTLKVFFARKGLFWKSQAKQTLAELVFYNGLGDGEIDVSHPSQAAAGDAIGPANDLRDDDKSEKEDEDEKKGDKK